MVGDVGQQVGRGPARIHADERQRSGCHEPLRDAPIAAEQVGEIQDVEADLEAVGVSPEPPRDVL